MFYGGTGKQETYAEIDIESEIFLKLKTALAKLKSESKLSTKNIIELVEREEEVNVPVSLFKNRDLGILEVLVKYLHENQGLSFNEIAHALKRDNRTIWSSYDKTKIKHKAPLDPIPSEFVIPVSIFSDRRLGVLEVLVSYLRYRFNLKYCEISELLSRDQRTIWTVYNRALKKKRQT